MSKDNLQIEPDKADQLLIVEIATEPPLNSPQISTPNEQTAAADISKNTGIEVSIIETALISAESHNSTQREPAFTCDNLHRSACNGLPFFKEHEGKPYCVLHCPSKDKSIEFDKVIQKKLAAHDYDFCGVWFPEECRYFRGVSFHFAVDFSYATFRNEADFTGTVFHYEAHFNSTTFNQKATFNTATFREKAIFNKTTFRAGVSFHEAIFNSLASFYYAIFSTRTSFDRTKFSAEAYFKEAEFTGLVSFFRVEFNDKTVFERTLFREVTYLSLQEAEMKKPERVVFHSVTLRPQWFVEVNEIKKLNFTNIRWQYKTRRWMTWGKGVISAIDELKAHGFKEENVYSLLSKACRQLALSEEESHRYDEAADLRYWSMRATRLEKGRHWAFWRLDWLYWLTSGYGERIGRAALILLAIWFSFALLYTQADFEVKKTELSKVVVEVRKPEDGQGLPEIVQVPEPVATSDTEVAAPHQSEIGHPLPVFQAMNYSFSVMALQKPEPKPVTNAARALVTFETVLGPLQAALLALAIRRRFMR